MKITHPPHPLINMAPFFGPLGLAVLGQYFLVQRNEPWTILPGLFLYALAAFLLSRNLTVTSPTTAKGPISLRVEILCFFLIFALGLFFRLYHLDQFPKGIFLDEGCEGWGALRILKEGWRPFYEVNQTLVWAQSIYYTLALWFSFVSPSQVSLFGASVFIGLAAFPFLYWAFRQLTNPPTALIALFLMAIMRWHLTYSRNAHLAIEMPFYISGTLALWLYAHRARKAWTFLLAGFVCGLGLYSYKAYKPFLLLMVLYAAYEWIRSTSPRNLVKPYALFFLGVLAISGPLWWEWIHVGLDSREKELMAFPAVYVAGGIRGVVQQFMGTALAFNRIGDSWCIHNLPYQPLLDDGTGILFLLGLGWALTRIKERANFYAVVGFLVMCLPAFLSIAPNHASRLFGTIPFIALLAAQMLMALLSGIRGLLSGKKSFGLLVFLIPLVAFCAFQNFWIYFEAQAKNNDCWRAENGAEASWIGRNISSLGKDYSFLVCSRFYGNYTIEFLAFDQRDAIHPLTLSQSLDLHQLPRNKGVCIALDEGHTGVLKLFQTLYPGGDVQIFRDLNGNPIAYLYFLTSRLITLGPGPKALPPHYGLEGIYQNTPGTTALQKMAEIAPVLNFTFRNDFPINRFPPLWARWKGKLLSPQAGTYEFVILTSDKGTLDLDGNSRIGAGQSDSGKLFLGKGPHEIQAGFEKTEGTDAAFTLLWKKPGDGQYEVIPATAFRH